MIRHTSIAVPFDLVSDRRTASEGRDGHFTSHRRWRNDRWTNAHLSFSWPGINRAMGVEFSENLGKGLAQSGLRQLDKGAEQKGAYSV